VADLLRKNTIGLSLAAVAYLVLFWPALEELVGYWSEDPDFSHGFLIPVICGVILWSNRKELGNLSTKPSTLGLIAVGFFVGVFFVGYLTRTNVIQRCGLWGALVSGCWAAFGTALLRAKPFPFFYLLLAIPPHYALLNSIRISLKGYATILSSDALKLLGVDAIPQGNVLVTDGYRLEVADACSGIRSLMAIVATAILFAYLFRTGVLRGSILVATAIPVTILVNVLRIVIVATALVNFDIDLTTGLAHESIGMVVFGISIVALYTSWLFYQWLFRWKPREEDA
jgi:exosortase